LDFVGKEKEDGAEVPPKVLWDTAAVDDEDDIKDGRRWALNVQSESGMTLWLFGCDGGLNVVGDVLGDLDFVTVLPCVDAEPGAVGGDFVDNDADSKEDEKGFFDDDDDDVAVGEGIEGLVDMVTCLILEEEEVAGEVIKGAAVANDGFCNCGCSFFVCTFANVDACLAN
jgi:hypothetical protein